MAEIRTLLNPAPELDPGSPSDTDRSSTNMSFYAPEYSPGNPARKKQKVCKDAAVFVRGSIRGECRYPPHEFQDDQLAAQHERFDVYPIGEIADFPRHIPYNSEKKLFQERTGRESLEVFQYCFKIPGDDTQYAMLWDYNIGLVRTTPLFKCTGHSKTTPAKMLNRNPGLREICHSITGGALVAQGYWMPYEAAKAIAATFCWEIRHALTPVFGIDFPDLCIPPHSDKYGDMIINPEITRHCTTRAEDYRRMGEGEEERSTAAEPTSRASTASPLTPDTPTHPRHHHHPTKQFRLKPPRLVADTCGSPSDAGSECSNTDTTTTLSLTPEARFRSLWTPANTPRSIPRSVPCLPPSPTLSRKRQHQHQHQHQHHHKSPSVSSLLSVDPLSPNFPPRARPREPLRSMTHDGDSPGHRSTRGENIEEQKQQEESLLSDGSVSMNDLHAARMLMELKLRTRVHQEREDDEARHHARMHICKKRRASA